MTAGVEVVGVLPLGLHRRGDIGDPLDRHYTPKALARACLERVVADGILSRPPRVVLDPSVGGGTWLDAAEDVFVDTPKLWACDVDPEAAGLSAALDRGGRSWLGSWPVVARTLRIDGDRPDLVAGNPPFSEDTAIDHVHACLDVAGPEGVVALILPWSFAGGVGRWDWLHDDPRSRPSVILPIRTPRPWGDRIRETALYAWRSETEREARGFPRPVLGEPIAWRGGR